MTQDDGAKALFNSSSMSGSPIKIHYVSIVMCQHENYNLNEDKISIFDDNKNYEDIFFFGIIRHIITIIQARNIDTVNYWNSD